MPEICQGPNCENALNGKRRDAIYCSSQCKLNAYHARKGTTTKQKREVIICQRKGCSNKIPEYTKITARYCSNACRQKVYNDTHKEEQKKKRDEVRTVEQEKKQKKADKKAVDEFIQELMGE